MTLFENHQLRDAFVFADTGEQVLLLCRPRRGQTARAMLIDRNTERLWATARRFGIRKVRVQRGGAPGQHVILEGFALEVALAECAQPELKL